MRERAAWLVASVVENSDDARVADDSDARVVNSDHARAVEDSEVSDPR